MTEAAVTTLNPEGSSPFVLLCEHASNHIPEPYKGLGLGAADLARQLSARLDAPLFLSG